MQPSGRVSLSADHEVRLETLEHQLMRLIHNTVSWVWLMFSKPEFKFHCDSNL